MVVEVLSWEENKELTYELLRNRYSSKSRYRVSKRSYDPGVSFPAGIRKCLLFVLNGSCCYTSEKDSVILHGETYTELPSAKYKFKVLGDVKLSIVYVWDLHEFGL